MNDSVNDPRDPRTDPLAADSRNDLSNNAPNNSFVNPSNNNNQSNKNQSNGPLNETLDNSPNNGRDIAHAANPVANDRINKSLRLIRDEAHVLLSPGLPNNQELTVRRLRSIAAAVAEALAAIGAGDEPKDARGIVAGAPEQARIGSLSAQPGGPAMGNALGLAQGPSQGVDHAQEQVQGHIPAQTSGYAQT